MELNDDIIKRIKLLDEKFKASGQDLVGYLDGLLHASYLTYWDYIHLDTLLSLQNPKTAIPDEPIFIMYHQITELYFKLALHEMEQVHNNDTCTGDFLLKKVTRINRYFEMLVRSFEVMVDGMEHKQFLEFRMSLLPASGFQSMQYRTIELGCTEVVNLVAMDKRAYYKANNTVELYNEMYQNIYWKNGATDAVTGAKSLTLEQFEQQYDAVFLRTVYANTNKTINSKYLALAPAQQQEPKLIAALRELDTQVNINWPLAHYKSAVRYLNKGTVDAPATGGTNWQKYLPPRFQQRIFFPTLWSTNEIEQWGKSWVDTVVK